jgi:tetratricopeptide (TPR) repeat protein
MQEIQRTINSVRPALSHLQAAETQRNWQQWLTANKPAVIASVCIFSLLAVSTLLASRYQFAAPLPSANNPQTTKASTTLDQATAANPAPFAQLTLEQAQQAARDELGRFVEQQLLLEQRFNLGEWSSESMDGATDTALVGDEYFQTQDYLNALASYQQAADQIAQTIQLGQAALAQAIDATVLAIDNLNPAKAARSLSQARGIAPSDATIAALQQRIDVLPEIIVLLRQGLNLGLQERYEDALSSYAKITALDPLTASLNERIVAAQTNWQAQQLRQWLSDGFSALEGSDFAGARKAFNKVTAVAPDNSAALGGLEQVAQLYDVAFIRSAESDAANAMAAGAWDKAISAYQRILDLDSNLSVGRSGIASAQEHKRINALINAVIAQPQRLSEPRLFNDAERALASAELLASKPANFTDAIEQVAKIL